MRTREYAIYARLITISFGLPVVAYILTANIDIIAQVFIGWYILRAPLSIPFVAAGTTPTIVIIIIITIIVIILLLCTRAHRNTIPIYRTALAAAGCIIVPTIIVL
jgi:hypothetical protein